VADETLAAFAEASVRLGTPLALAALGELVSERAGVLNIGIEGCMIAGALGGALGAWASGDPVLGVVTGTAAGLAVSLVLGGLIVGMGADQVIVGTAVSIGCLGLTGVIYQVGFGATGTALSFPALTSIALPGLSELPVAGAALFDAPGTFYLAGILAIALWWYLFRTGWGLQLRAVGEDPDAAAAAGVRVRQPRMLATSFGGALAGLAGAHLSLAYAGTFAEHMTAGRGFIALAVVALGLWHPFAVLGAAPFFGAASALQFQGQAMGVDLPHEVFLVLPYVLTLLALAGRGGRARAPKALGSNWSGV